jgi:hypothetical protein
MTNIHEEDGRATGISAVSLSLMKNVSCFKGSKQEEKEEIQTTWTAERSNPGTVAFGQEP